MKMNSDMANKTIKNLYAEISTLSTVENHNRTYTYASNEQPQIPPYSFTETQAKFDELRGKIAVIRHAINVFNVSTKVQGFDLTVDEALGRMSVLHREKSRLYNMLQIPDMERSRAYNSQNPDYTCRNFDIEEVQVAYDNLCDELMRLQQAINIANLTIEFEIPLESL